jgi:Leucine-rich repeat (LRR) protein
VQVRKGSIRSFLDGNPILNWSGDFSRLKLPHGFRLSTSEPRLAMGGWHGDVIFHRATVREISGAGQLGTVKRAAGGGSISLAELKAVVDWTVSQKGYVIVADGGMRRKITRAEEMPTSAGQLLELEVPSRGANTVPPAVVTALGRAKELVRLVMISSNLKPQDATSLVADKPQLKYVDLHGNPIDDSIIAAVANLPKMETLNLGYCKKITGSGLDKLATRPQLLSLVVNDCTLSDAALPAIGKLVSLKSLNLQGNKITDKGLEQLGGLTRLETLYLKNTEVTVNGVMNLRDSRNLRRVEVSLGKGIKSPGELNPLGAAFPAFKELAIDVGGPKEKENVKELARLGDLSALKSLTRLDLRGSNAVQASMIRGLDQLPVLEYVDISYHFKDDDVALLKGARTLKTLRLANADLTELGALALASVASLRDVNRGAFSEAGLKTFREYRTDVKIVD